MHLPDLHYACVHCGYSCQDLEVEISDVEFARVARLAGPASVEKKNERLWLNKGCQGCTLLSDDGEGRCTLHREHGMQAKPRACREFPFRAIETPSGPFVGASFACRAIATRQGPKLSNDSFETRSLQLPPTPLAEGTPFDWERYLRWESRVGELLATKGEIGLWTAALELGCEIQGRPMGPPSAVIEDGLWLLFRGLLALAEGAMDEPTLMAFLQAHQNRGTYHSRLTDSQVNVASVLSRWEEPWSLWSRALPFFEHLLFRKYLLEGPDVYSRICSLPVLAQLLQFLALSRTDAKPGEEEFLWALRILEERLTFHSRGLERYLGKFGALFLS